MQSFTKHSVLIDRPIEEVFDLITTVKYWPEWHPSSLETWGQTETPAKIGDEATERVQIGAIKGEITWVVSRYNRPWLWEITATEIKLPLMSKGSTKIVYDLARSEKEVLFVRTHSYQMPTALTRFYDRVRFRNKLNTDSGHGIVRIKEMVEKILPESGLDPNPDPT